MHYINTYVNKCKLLFQGTGRYAIYIANYASGNVGPHALIEMDEVASDLSQGVIALSNVAEQAGVNKFTGRFEEMIVCVCLCVCVTYNLPFFIQHHWTFSLIYTHICRGACACCACLKYKTLASRAGEMPGRGKKTKKRERKKEREHDKCKC